MPASDVPVVLMPQLGPAAADYPPGSTFGPRDARSFEFVWVLRGRASWSCGDMAAELPPGRLLLVRPGMRDFFRWDTHGPTRHAYVHFLLHGADEAAPASYEHWPAVRALNEQTGPMAALCAYLLWLGDTQPEHWQVRAVDVLGLLLTTFVSGPFPRDDPGDVSPPLRAMLRHVARRWSDGVARPVQLADLAAAAAVSPSSLSRLFRQRFSVGPVAAIERLRLARA
jgi:AraC family transcriptional regulator